MSANWHWKTKSVKDPWCKEWLRTKLVGLESDGVRITAVDEVEGDAEVGMRKSKVITIYDLKVVCKWDGPTSDDAASTGTLTVLEVSHDMDEGDYQFESASDGNSPNSKKHKETARKQIGDLMRPILQQLHKDMVEAHGKDLLAGENQSPATSGTSNPAVSNNASASKYSSKSSASGAPAKAGNTATVSAQGNFMISAADLFELLTDPSKVPMWTRNTASIKAEKGSEVSLFGGNITGKVVSVDKPREFVMTWRAPTWPEQHFGQLTSTLTQNAADTTLNLKLTGVPLGREDETERNLDIYYIRSLKQIGYGLNPPLSKKALPPPAKPHTRLQKMGMAFATILGPLASFALLAGVVLAIYYGPAFQQK